eukprot:350397-Chlamydomonas_euryale.AAC.1
MYSAPRPVQACHTPAVAMRRAPQPRQRAALCQVAAPAPAVLGAAAEVAAARCRPAQAAHARCEAHTSLGYTSWWHAAYVEGPGYGSRIEEGAKERGQGGREQG